MCAAGKSSPKGGRFARCAWQRPGSAGGHPALLFSGGGSMISAWWLVPAVLAGAFIGVMIIALCAAGANRGDKDE